MFPDIAFAASEYVYNNRYGEIFFISFTDFAPNYVIGVINSESRLPDFNYEKLISKPLPFDDLSRIQIDYKQIKEQIYDSFDLLYHEATITKASCFNPSLFIRDPSPNKILNAKDYENYATSCGTENEVNYYNPPRGLTLADFSTTYIKEQKYENGKTLKTIAKEICNSVNVQTINGGFNDDKVFSVATDNTSKFDEDQSDTANSFDSCEIKGK